MIFSLVTNLIKTVHDLTNHPTAAIVLRDAVSTVDDVASIVPEATLGNAGLVVDAINAIAGVFENAQNTPTTISTTSAADTISAPVVDIISPAASADTITLPNTDTIVSTSA